VSILRGALQRIGGVRELPSIHVVRSPQPFGYRSRARVAHAHGRVGFRAWHSHEVVDIERCLVLDEETQNKLNQLREHPPRARGEIEIRGYGEKVDVAGRRLAVGPQAFFQANRLLWERWLELVSDACGRGELALELYAGVGFYTAEIERNFESVIAVERGASAADARRNTSARVIEAAAETWLPQQIGLLEPDLVLMNPPRTGCDPRVMSALRALAPARVVYVSCEPSTLARDLSRLGPTFRLTGLSLLDALPQTEKVEAVATLEHVDSVHNDP
jgi:23S rRNA (uracil1939-C5)-methyltransferase